LQKSWVKTMICCSQGLQTLGVPRGRSRASRAEDPASEEAGYSSGLNAMMSRK
jgi:hypothetical protein